MSTNPDALRIAVIGSRGSLGRALAQAALCRDPGVLLAAKRDAPITLDLADPEPDLSAFGTAGVRAAVIAAGATRMAACEADPRGTRAVNVEGTLRLARRLADMGARVVWFSTDYVFDGSADSYPDDAPTSPLNEYGRQKAEVEAALPGVCDGNCLILRLGKVYGETPGDGTILDEMFALLAAGRSMRAARDQIFNQVAMADATRATLALLDRDVTGTFNVCAPMARSRLSLALMAAEALGAPPELVESISLDDLGESFKRPKRVVLMPERIGRELDFSFRRIEEAVARLARDYSAGGVHDRPRS